MKRYILVVGLYLFIAVLMAETGLFDLSYGQDLAEAHAALLAKGFEETGSDDFMIIYINDQIPELIDLEVWDSFDEDTVSSWIVRYNVQDNAGLVQKLLSDLKAIHKKDPIKNDSNFDEWFWDLGDTYEMGMYLSEDKSTLTIEYIDIDEPFYW
ncbi:MAG: hypothetical protein LHW41_08100 [Candidatus Cloacimonetes bacterium]|nr:hypothetical protein [Candidatus Cloacimonadota bacterium]